MFSGFVEDKELRIPITEIFGPTIQGEGQNIGKISHFVRVAGCPLRCVWCDTKYSLTATKDTKLLTPSEIFGEVRKLGPAKLVVITGGEPALIGRPITLLIDKLHGAKYHVSAETSGAAVQPWFAVLDYLTISPKGPSSGNAVALSSLFECINTAFRGANYANVSVKVVIFDDEDLDYAREIRRKLSAIPMYLQVGTPTRALTTDRLLEGLKNLIEKIKGDPIFADVAVLPQLHVLLYGRRKGV